jgi:hypothetical protein
MVYKDSIFIIDVDGVACEHAKAICNWVSQEYNISVKTNEVTSWDHNFGPITFIEAVEKCYPNEEFLLKMEVTPGFNEFLADLMQIVTVKFATSRKYGRKATQLWINKNFGAFETFFVKRKAELTCDYIADDYLGEVVEATNLGKKCFLFSRPWNDNDNTKNEIEHLNNVYYVRSFNEILSILNDTL